MLQAILRRSLQRFHLASVHRSGKCTPAHNTQAVRGLPENKQNSDNRKETFILELKCPFTWELSSFQKENMHAYTHDSSLDGRPLPGAQQLKLQKENSAPHALSACFSLLLMMRILGVNLLRKVQRIHLKHSQGIYPCLDHSCLFYAVRNRELWIRNSCSSRKAPLLPELFNLLAAERQSSTALNLRSHLLFGDDDTSCRTPCFE